MQSLDANSPGDDNLSIQLALQHALGCAQLLVREQDGEVFALVKRAKELVSTQIIASAIGIDSNAKPVESAPTNTDSKKHWYVIYIGRKIGVFKDA